LAYDMQYLNTTDCSSSRPKNPTSDGGSALRLNVAKMEGEVLERENLEGLWTMQTASHIGIVVKDLEKGLREFGSSLEYDWVTTYDAETPVRSGDGSVRVVRVQTRWATIGPPHIELIQSVPGTVWETQNDSEIHHIGFWVDDLAAASERLAKLGFPLEATFDSESSQPTAFAYHSRPGAVRIELTDSSRRGQLLEVLAAPGSRFR
jgi:hypothetical protein